MPRQPPNPEERAIFAGVTGQQPPSQDDVPGMAGFVYGRNRNGNPDTTAIGRRFGVSRSTARRWVTGKTRIPPRVLTAMRAGTTRAIRSGRAGRLSSDREAKLRGRPATITVTGRQGVRGYPKNNYSATIRDFPPAHLERIVDAYQQGGDVVAALIDGLQAEYHGDWDIEQLTGFTIT